MTDTDRTQPADAPTAAPMMVLSNEMVRLYKNLFGRGPTRARANYAGPDTVLCTLEESLTPAERSLVAMGEHQRLRDVRLFFQHARERDFRDAVERITGRKVRGFVSGMDTHEDIAAELFYLEPDDDAASLHPLPSETRADRSGRDGSRAGG
jgi:uncharacterized protein YbcI